jgi:molybdopterin-guanine dinucleotide biosynthesis protein A
MASAATGLAAGFVLAGGNSRRMGSNKALLPWLGTTLVEHVSNQVRLAVGSAHVVGGSDTLAGLGLSVIDDLFPGEGPLGGIITALTNSPAEWNLIVACDMPAVTAGELARLLETAGRLDCDAAIPKSADEREHPLCGVYRRQALPKLRDAWERGTRSVVAALGAIRTAYVPVEDARGLTNVNTPADWDALRSTIR